MGGEVIIASLVLETIRWMRQNRSLIGKHTDEELAQQFLLVNQRAKEARERWEEVTKT